MINKRLKLSYRLQNTKVMCIFKSKEKTIAEAKRDIWRIAKTIPTLSHALYCDIRICAPDKEKEWETISDYLSKATERIEKISAELAD